MAFNDFIQDPQKLALLTAGINMMASAQGGNRDLTKQGLGYGLQQGLLGANQGYQMGTAYRDKALKDKQRDNILGLLDDRPANAPESVGGAPAVGPTQPARAGILSDATPCRS